MTGNLYDRASTDLLNACVALIVARLATAEAFSLPMVLANLNAARDALQGEGPLAVVATADVPDGMLTTYRSAVGIAHDRALAFFEAALTL